MLLKLLGPPRITGTVMVVARIPVKVDDWKTYRPPQRPPEYWEALARPILRNLLYRQIAYWTFVSAWCGAVAWLIWQIVR